MVGDVVAALASGRPWDVLVPGYLDRDRGHPQFRPMPLSVYVALESGYVRFDSIGNFGQLRMRLVDEIEVPVELGDDDDEFALGSFALPFFADSPSPFRGTGVRYVEDAESRPNRGIVKCAEFAFNNVWKLFLDPTWHFGIRLGASGAYESWRSDHFDPSTMKETSISAEDVAA